MTIEWDNDSAYPSRTDNEAEAPAESPRVVMTHELPKLLHTSQAKVNRLLKAKDCPQPVKLNGKPIGWNLDEFEYWYIERSMMI